VDILVLNGRGKMQIKDKMKANEVSSLHRRFRNSNYLPLKIMMYVLTGVCNHKTACRFSAFMHGTMGDLHCDADLN
jgi:hypothetical protein